MSVSLPLAQVLGSLPPESLDTVEALVAAAAAAGVRILLVGGPVRDLLLEREIRDVDLIAEPADPDAPDGLAEIVRGAAPASARIVEHGRFGTLRVEWSEAVIDVARVRRERYERPGALPQVEPGTLEEDLLRRDFSINALAIPLAGDGRGRVEVIDVAGGLADLGSRRLRVLHRRSFHDDPTRVLRAARLAPRLGFTLARDARSALRDALRDGAFGGVSGDRLRREIEKCFSDAALGLDPARALRLLSDWHVLSALEPGLGLPRECVTALRRLGRALEHPPWRAGRFRPWIAGLALWLAPQPAALRRRALRRFSVRGEAARRVVEFGRTRDRLLGALARARGRGAVDALLAGSEEEELHALHASAPPAIQRRIVRWAAEDRPRRLPVSGRDLLALGVSGPAVGRTLERIRIAFLDGEVANREEAVALAEELARSGRRRQGAAVERARGRHAVAKGTGSGAQEAAEGEEGRRRKEERTGEKKGEKKGEKSKKSKRPGGREKGRGRTGSHGAS